MVTTRKSKQIQRPNQGWMVTTRYSKQSEKTSAKMQSRNLQHLPALLCLLVGLGGGAGDLANHKDNDDDGDNHFLLESISFKI